MSIAFRVIIEDQPMGYHPMIARVSGGLAEGVTLGRLLYWDGVMARKYGDKYSGEFYKSDDELREETALSVSELKTAKKHLKELGFISIKVRGIPPTSHYTLNIETIQAAIENGDAPITNKRARNEHGKFTTTANQLATNGELKDHDTVNQSTENRRDIQYGTQDCTHDLTQRESGQKSPAPAEPPKAEKPAKPKADLFPVASTLSEVCQMPFEINRGRLFREAKQLCAGAVVPPVKPDEIRARYGAGGWWYREDWRGQKGEPPTPAAIKATWGQWAKAKVIPFKAGKPTKGQIIKELLNGDGTDNQGDLGVIFGGVSVAPRGNGHAESVAGRLANGTGGCT